MKKIWIPVIIGLLIGCVNRPKGKKSSKAGTEEKTMLTENAKVGKKNFAVVWKWKTKNVKLVEDNIIAITQEMRTLREKGIIENAYYNSDAKIDKFAYFPNISFFVKAKNPEEVQSILNRLILVKKGIATFDIYPVGTKWLGRQEEVIYKKGITRSFVAAWLDVAKIDLSKDQKLLEAQADAILKLNAEGIIENVYWDFEDVNAVDKEKSNEIRDFVFFVNANTEDEARKICDSLPFAKEKIASYRLYPVGSFWFGSYEEQEENKSK